MNSHASPDLQGENNEILKAIDQVSEAVQNRGIYVIGRGGDRDALYEPLLKQQRNFIIRMVGSRDVIHKGKRPVHYGWLMGPDYHMRKVL